jgi:hypothetical protein
MAVPEENTIMPVKRAHRQRKSSADQFAGLAVAPDCLDWAGFAGELFSTFPPDAVSRAASTPGLPDFVVSGVTPAPVCPPGSGPMAIKRGSYLLNGSDCKPDGVPANAAAENIER